MKIHDIVYLFFGIVFIQQLRRGYYFWKSYPKYNNLPRLVDSKRWLICRLQSSVLLTLWQHFCVWNDRNYIIYFHKSTPDSPVNCVHAHVRVPFGEIQLDFLIRSKHATDIVWCAGFFYCASISPDTRRLFLIRALIQRTPGPILHNSPGNEEVLWSHDMFAVISMTCGATQPIILFQLFFTVGTFTFSIIHSFWLCTLERMYFLWINMLFERY